MPADLMRYDVFISHASEDKDEIARPLAQFLQSRGLKVWFDEMELRLGDSLRRSIDRGLAESKYGVVILSHDFFGKEWPQKELDGLVAREDGRSKVILPIWHKVNREDVSEYSPLLAGKLAAPTSKGLPYIVDQIVREVEATREHPTSEAEPADPRTPKGSDIATLLVDMIDRMNEAAEGDFNEVTGVRTGFVDLDRITSGLQPGAFTLIGGRPRTGKTSFALQVAQHVAVVEGLPVILCTPSTSAKQTTERLIGMRSDIPAARLRSAHLTDAEWGSVSEAMAPLVKATLHVCDEPSISVFELQSEARRLTKLWGAVGAVIVDGIQELLDPRTKDADEVCRELKRLARELNCPVLATTILHRSVDLRADRRPMLSDLAEVGPIEHHADSVLLAYRSAAYGLPYEQDVMEVLVVKDRDGAPVATVRLGIGPFGSLGNLSPHSGESRYP